MLHHRQRRRRPNGQENGKAPLEHHKGGHGGRCQGEEERALRRSDAEVNKLFLKSFLGGFFLEVGFRRGRHFFPRKRRKERKEPPSPPPSPKKKTALVLENCQLRNNTNFFCVCCVLCLGSQFPRQGLEL